MDQAIRIITIVVATIYGAVIGSYLNVCIYRVPLKISTMKGRSFCPECKNTLTALQLIPIVSYLALGGKCKHCKSRISARYLLIELLTALLFCLSAVYKYPSILLIVLNCTLVCCCIVTGFIDYDTKEIPDRMHVFIALLAVVKLASGHINIMDALIGAVVISIPLFIIAIITGGFGGGDIKLFAVAGLFLGYKLILITFLISTITAAAYGIWLVATKKASAKEAIAFGPHICAALVFCSML